MPADERAEIEAAMDRLLAGTPLRSGGQLTIVSLAAEAGVKRHALTHKHTDLKDRFYARVKAQDSIPASETALREQNAELRRKLDDMRAERDEYKQAADALARALNVLTIENDELRRKANRAAPFMGPRPLTPLRRVPAGWRPAAAPPGCRRG
jgi:chromosome segregation ATPase